MRRLDIGEAIRLVGPRFFIKGAEYYDHRSNPQGQFLKCATEHPVILKEAQLAQHPVRFQLSIAASVTLLYALIGLRPTRTGSELVHCFGVYG